MQGPITVNYLPDGDDWVVTVNHGGLTRQATAPGLIAARDRADQLVEQLAPDEPCRTVVHLLDGDAYAFTVSYLHARLGLADDGRYDIPAPAEPSESQPGFGYFAPAPSSPQHFRPSWLPAR